VFASLGPRSADLAIVGALVLSGVGLGVATPSVTASVANAVDDVDLGVASAAQQLMAQIGIVAGIQVMATIQVSAEASAGLIGSFRQAYVVGAIVSVGAVVCGAFVRRHQRHRTDPALVGATVPTR
jgi:hypothetical protein